MLDSLLPPVKYEDLWRRHMREAFRSVRELCDYLDIDASEVVSASAAEDFPLFAPRPFVDRIRRGDTDDPLLRQVLPIVDETVNAEGYTRDPLGEADATVQPGLLQKYAGRALLIVTGACAIHCRYCFRRHFPYGEISNSPEHWQTTLDTVRRDPSIDEVILSGGDPLTLVDERIGPLLREIDSIDHVKRIRLHTRLPIMIPDRITPHFASLLANSRAQAIMVIHANHASEIGEDVVRSLDRLRTGGIPLLNQSVLLKGVNDSVEIIENLCRRLINVGVMPYYLHQLDRVQGAAHFEVEDSTGLQIISQLRSRLPGYAIPQYVREVPYDDAKRPIIG